MRQFDRDDGVDNVLSDGVIKCTEIARDIRSVKRIAIWYCEGRAQYGEDTP